MPAARLSLKDVFGLVAFSAVVAWCAAQVGFDNLLLWMALFASLAMSWVFVALAKREKLRVLAALLPVPVVLSCLLFGSLLSLSLFVNAFLLMLVGACCGYSPSPPMKVRTLWTFALICSAASLVVGVFPGMAFAEQIVALRQKYPIESLTARLQYEERDPAVATRATPEISKASDLRLLDMESQFDHGYSRRSALFQVHSRQYELFVRAQGFGATRMMRPSESKLGVPPLRDVLFREESPQESDDDWYDQTSMAQLETYRKSDEAKHLHEVSRFVFMPPATFGAVFGSIERVAGFVEHGFRDSPVNGLKDPETWTIERLELVSLLKFDEPRVYVLDHLPRMDKLSEEGIATRPLDAFEAKALAQLWTEEDVVIAQDSARTRMLGSLRAAEQCLDCHSVERGELLGAFSYALTPGPSHVAAKQLLSVD